eukprot:scpid18085/ scgid24773/ 
MVLFSGNKTGAWLEQQSTARKEELFSSALHGAEKHRQQYRQRCAEIAKFRREEIIAKEADRQSREKRALEVRQQLSVAIGQAGCWTDTDIITSKLAGIATVSGKVSALKTQLKFRKVVLQQKADKKLFQFSHAGKQLTWQQLAANLLELVGSTVTPVTTSEVESSTSDES